MSLDVVLARIEGRSARGLVECLASIDSDSQDWLDDWHDASPDRVEREAITLFVEGAIVPELRRL